jgi:3-isopropylmalate dehydrogenase
MKIAVLPGDGIGPEIIAQARRVLDVLRQDGLPIELEEAPLGGAGYDAYGVPYPEFTQKLCRAADAVLLGAVAARNTTRWIARCARSAACWPSART